MPTTVVCACVQWRQWPKSSQWRESLSIVYSITSLLVLVSDLLLVYVLVSRLCVPGLYDCTYCRTSRTKNAGETMAQTLPYFRIYPRMPETRRLLRALLHSLRSL